MKTTIKYVRPAIMLTLLLTITTGLVYPGIVTGLAQLIFPYQANGSLHTVDGKVIGSDLIGQYWTATKYFHGRPSATLNPGGTPQPYSADNSAASNLGPTNKQLIDGNGGTYQGVKNYADQFRKENGLAPNAPLPSDIVTASGSGLDPDISVEAALLQVNRIAQARGLNAGTVKQIVENHIQGRFLWIFGEPHVNVLDLNLALDGKK
ncbi:MAG: potassium-transporting ATPase subunit KdpC [Ktedonobacteraceae bacterium]|nr:potassium-transporting ATPase subunit KdpC [Ktedonobacteraceae bacterium]